MIQQQSNCQWWCFSSQIYGFTLKFRKMQLQLFARMDTNIQCQFRWCPPVVSAQQNPVCIELFKNSNTQRQYLISSSSSSLVDRDTGNNKLAQHRTERKCILQMGCTELRHAPHTKTLLGGMEGVMAIRCKWQRAGWPEVVSCCSVTTAVAV